MTCHSSHRVQSPSLIGLIVRSGTVMYPESGRPMVHERFLKFRNGEKFGRTGGGRPDFRSSDRCEKIDVYRRQGRMTKMLIDLGYKSSDTEDPVLEVLGSARKLEIIFGRPFRERMLSDDISSPRGFMKILKLSKWNLFTAVSTMRAIKNDTVRISSNQKVLEVCSHLEYPYVLSSTAGNLRTRPETLERLAHCRAQYARQAVSMNRNTSIDTLIGLLLTPSSTIHEGPVDTHLLKRIKTRVHDRGLDRYLPHVELLTVAVESGLMFSDREALDEAVTVTGGRTDDYILLLSAVASHAELLTDRIEPMSVLPPGNRSWGLLQISSTFQNDDDSDDSDDDPDFLTDDSDD